MFLPDLVLENIFTFLSYKVTQARTDRGHTTQPAGENVSRAVLYSMVQGLLEHLSLVPDGGDWDQHVLLAVLHRL